MVQVTDAAIVELKNQLNSLKVKEEDAMIRLYMSAGWGGPQLQLALEESALDNDSTIKQGGVTFLVNERDQGYLSGITIDFRETWFGNGQFVMERNGSVLDNSC